MNKIYPSIKPIRGNMLTCFTSALATYFAADGLDYTFAFGLQLYLALKIEERDELKSSFIYFHRPLPGDFPLYRLRVKRSMTNDQSCALMALLCEYREQKRLLIPGDAYNLPWHINYRKKHAIHWFVVEEINESQQRIHIHDPFEFVDVYGTQSSYDGWLPLSSLTSLAQVCSNPSYAYLARDFHGLGTDEYIPLEEYHGYQWFEISSEVKPQKISNAYIFQELVSTYHAMAGQVRREDLSQNNWYMGLEALAVLPELFCNHLTNPALYEMKDDLWGVCRHHQLFAYTLRQIARESGQLSLEALANWCEETLIPLWSSLPRIMLYNSSCIAHQRPPRDILVQCAEEIYRAEKEFMDRLTRYLCQNGTFDIPSIQEGTFSSKTDCEEREDNPQHLLEGKAATLGSTGPRTAVEQRVMEVWVEVMKREAPGIHYDFFRSGGDSLAATRILSRLQAIFQIEISLLEFMDTPTIAAVSALISKRLEAE